MQANFRDSAARSPLIKRHPLLVLSDVLLLLLCLLSAVYSFVSAYGIEVNASLLCSCLLSGVCLAIIFSLSRSKHRAALLLLVGAGYGFMLWRQWSVFKAGALAVYSDIVNLLAEKLQFTDGMQLSSTLSRTAWIDARIWFVDTVSVLLAIILGWAVVRKHSTCLTILVSLAPLIPALLTNSLPWWPAFMTLVACWLTLLLTSRMRRPSPSGAGRFALLALPACLALLFTLSAVYPRSTYKHPQWAFNAYNRLMDFGSDVAAYLQSDRGFLPGLSRAAGSNETVNLSEVGPLHYTGETVLRIEAEVPGRLYLRGHATALYDGASWKQLDAQSYQDFTEAYGVKWNGAEQPAYFPFFHHTLEAAPYRVQVQNIAAPSRCVYYPGQMVPNSGDGSIEHASFTQDICLTPEKGARTHTFFYYRPEELLRGTVSSAHDARQAEGRYRHFVYQHYRDVPEQFLTAVLPWREEAERLSAHYNPSVSSIPEPYRESIAAAWKVAHMLNATTKYDASTPAVPAGQDFAAYFLNESRRGYCMHFASAATLLLRSMGIPARYVSGYAVTVNQPGPVDVPDSAAHAWVEIYLDGYGWHPIEVTPAAGQEAPLPDDQEELPTEPDAPEQPPEADEPEPEQLTKPDEPADEVTEDGPEHLVKQPGEEQRWLLYFGCLAAAAAMLLLRRWGPFFLRQRRIRGTDMNQAVLYAYGYLLRLQPWRARMPVRVKELARKARFSQHVLTAEEAAEVLDFVQNEARRVDKSLSLWKRFAFRYLFGLY